jgi:hypothetical protein
MDPDRLKNDPLIIIARSLKVCTRKISVAGAVMAL